MAKRKRRKSTREAAPEHELPGGFWRQVGAVVLLALAVVLVMTWFGSGGNILNVIHNSSIYAIIINIMPIARGSLCLNFSLLTLYFLI